MADNYKATIKFTHKFPEDYRIVPANGAWGGISARGDLVMHFFVEHAEVPSEEIICKKIDGSIETSTKQKKEIKVTRAMQFGVMLPRDQATALAQWILEKVEKFEESKKRKRDGQK
ncbi:MAG TPA: hypothetical protein ENN36_10360 [Candidatus Bathyarchaeota archaeon]|nr:hypothetical protein [Candidatus Bathyarchaeota archaeon]